MAEGAHRPAWAEIDLGAIEHNASVLAAAVAPAKLCAVVKADAYGHGAVAVAGAALAGGASELAVAIVDEGVELREAGIRAPILVLSEPAPDGIAESFAHRLTPTVYTMEGIALAGFGAGQVRTGSRDQAAIVSGAPAPVELKVDTGMHRVGADPGDVVALVRAIAADGDLELAGLWTHLAVADEPDNPFTLAQLDRFAAVRTSIEEAGLPPPPRVHAANSAGAMAWPTSRLDMVRCGIAVYGYAPSPGLAEAISRDLRPALSIVARVSYVRELDAGARSSYGLARPLLQRSLVATVPLGYADGIPRAFFTGGGEVLVNGRRRRLAGTVTMDQIIVDCGDDWNVSPGDEVVLIGSQGDERVTAEDWALALDTISYEVVTRIGPRVTRLYKTAGSAAAVRFERASEPGRQALQH